jgi:hypothetical protein
MTLWRFVLTAALLATALLATAGLAAADQPAGCDAFRWPLETERAALVAADKPIVANGGALAYGSAETLRLATFAEAGLPHAPERAPKGDPSFAGHFTLAAPAKPGVYKITIASGGWIDVVDHGAFLHPKAFSEARGCEGARKSVKFDLPGGPVDVQLSNVRDPSIAVIVTPAD